MKRTLNVVSLETRVQLRYRIPLTALVMTAMWATLLAALPAHAARTVAPFLLLLDTATFGAAFLAALVMFERSDRSWWVLLTSPVRFGEYVGAKFFVLTSISVLSAGAIALTACRGSVPSFGSLIAGVAACTVLFLAMSFGSSQSTPSLARFLLLIPIPITPLVVVPLAHLGNLLSHPLAYLVPTTGAAELIRGGLTGSAPKVWHCAGFVGYLLLCTAAIVLWTYRRHERDRAGAPPVRRQVRRTSNTLRHHPVWAFARIDLRGIRSNGLLPVVVLAPLLLALALRFGYPPLIEHLFSQYGFDVRPYQDVVFAALVLLHVPLMVGMLGAVLLLDDAEDGTLLLMRTSPVTLRGYLGYRMVTVTTLAFAWLVIAVPLSGLAPGGIAEQVPAVVAAAIQAPLIALLVSATAATKVHGIALLKVAGGAMAVIPVALRFLPEASRPALLILPPTWSIHAMPPGGARTAFWLVGGVVVTLLASVALWRRTTDRLEHS